MNSVSHKLRSQRGVSILYALLLFLVAFMVSAVVIAASTSSIKSVYSDQAWKQESLELESAGKLVRQLIADVILVASTDDDGVVTISAQEPSKPLAPEICDAFSYLYNAVQSSSTSGSTTWYMTLTFNDERFNDIAVTFTMSFKTDMDDSSTVTYTIGADITLADNGMQHLYLYPYVTDDGSLSEFGWSQETANLTTIKASS